MTDDSEPRQEYKVRGQWPFPLDMLRRDDASPATEADSVHIQALTKDHCPSSTTPTAMHEIMLVRTQAHKWSGPNFDLWKSFGWEVVPESLPEHLRPMPQRRSSNITSIKTVADAENRVRLVGICAGRDPEAATLMERDFHRDVLYSIANRLTDDPQGVANVAFETWRLDFPRW